jgi:uncharacterized protein YbjT (DUF2867 family)
MAACVSSAARLVPSKEFAARARSNARARRAVRHRAMASSPDADTTPAEANLSERPPSRRQTLVSALAASVLASVSPLASSPALAAEGKRTVLVVGATGATGRLVVDELRRRGDADAAVVAAVRSEEKAKKLLSVDKGDIGVMPGFDVTMPADVLAPLMKSVDAEIVVVCTGFVPGNPFKMASAARAVDNEGVVHLVDAARRSGTVRRVVLISSILTDGRAMGAEDSPGFKITNAFGGVLDEKLVGERYLIDSGLEYCIVRPAGLRGEPPKSELIATPGNVMASGEVSRELVARVMAEAAFAPGAAGKIVEIAEVGTFASGYEPADVNRYVVGDDRSRWFP